MLVNHEACRVIQHVFSNQSLVNLMSKDVKPGILFISLQFGSLFMLAILM